MEPERGHARRHDESRQGRARADRLRSHPAGDLRAVPRALWAHEEDGRPLRRSARCDEGAD